MLFNSFTLTKTIFKYIKEFHFSSHQVENQLGTGGVNTPLLIRDDLLI